MAPVLYMNPVSPPCRAVQMVAAQLGIELEIKLLDMREVYEDIKQEFLAVNPAHTIPTLDDNGFHLYESRAIMAYLVNQYGVGDNSLYPKDPKQRAVIDQILNYDLGTMYKNGYAYFFPVIRGAAEDPAAKQKFQDSIKFVSEHILGQKKYLTGNDNFTIADISIAVALDQLSVMGFADLAETPNLRVWIERVAAAAKDYSKINGPTIEAGAKMREERIQKSAEQS